MESSRQQRYTKTSTTTSSCRLRQLNSDCHLKIFEYLDLQDLKELCNLDRYYYDLITSQVIAKKLINVEQLDERTLFKQLAFKRSTIELFAMFGKFMKKIAVRGEDFGLFLNIVLMYCKPDRLTEINLEFKLNSADGNLIDRSMSFFKNLRKMSLSDVNADGDGLYQPFLAKFAKSHSKVEILRM